MRVIKEASPDVFKAWGEGKISETEYRLIKYNLRKDVDEGTLLCNTVTGELILLDEEEKALLEKLPTKYDAKLDELIKHRFLVPADYDEHSAVLKLRKILQLLNPKKEITSYTILPTTCCNARCFYCYEANYKHISMSEQTADDVVKFIKDHHGDKKVSLNWFGGEPTLGEARIDQICKGLQAENIEYSSSMISNGYLFDEEMIAKAISLWKLKKIQITIDGTEKVYNKIKSYVNVSDNPYFRVLNNIKRLSVSEVFVDIRLNIGMHNIDDVNVLANYLIETFGENEHITIYAHKLFENKGFVPTHTTEEESYALLNKLVEHEVAFERKRSKFRKFVLPKINLYSCMADKDSAVLIHPDGRLFKCEHISEEDCIGDIYNGITNKSKVDAWKINYEYSICDSCPLTPSCVFIEKCDDREKCTETLRDWKIERVRNIMNLRKK